MKSEQQVLKISILATILLACFGIIFGILSGSSAVIFDGVYSLTDACLTVVALLVSNLITSSATGGAKKGKFIERFTMGFWHIEPMVLGLNGMMLMGASVYALINAVESILDGGRELEFGHGIIYAAVTLVFSLGMAAFGHIANRSIKSAFLALDVKAWLMSAGLTAALLVAFIFGYSIQGTELQWFSPYVDPGVLAVVCLIVIPIPIGTIRQAISDILLITPIDFKQHVDTVAKEIVRRYGFLSHRAYVARVGRGRQIELYFIVPEGWPAKRLEEWDRIREEIGEAIGEESPDRWLTIVFTTDPEWAD